MAAAAGIIILYCVAMIVAIASRRFRVPYTAALLVVGVALGASHVVTLPHLTRELLFAVFLPGLVFEAAYHLEIHELRENAWTIGGLAVPGVAAAIGLTAVLLQLGATLASRGDAIGWPAALLFGAVIAATDPVAVTALFREVSAPRRLLVLVESESLLNDGTSIVFLTLLLAYLSGEATTVPVLALDFVRIVAGGAAIGAALGWGVSHIRRRLEDTAIEITLTTVAAYGTFVLAEQLHCSGVVATVAAGVVCGHVARHHPMTADTRSAVHAFWEWLAFALNSAVFLLLGAEISPALIGNRWGLLVLAAVAALAARAVIVGITGVALGRTRERMPRPWLTVLTWGGLRGALSLVLALSLPESIAQRPLIVAMTAATVALSLVGQGATMGWVLRKTGVGGAHDSTTS